MKRILLDTNIYGPLVEDDMLLLELSNLVPNIFVIYGMPLIRKELRQISTKVTVEGKSKRNMVLIAYDSFVRKDNHTLHVNEFVLLLAHKYFEEYKKKGGTFSHDEMFSDKAKEAYKTINEEKQFRTPQFYTYDQFKEVVRRFTNVHSANSIE